MRRPLLHPAVRAALSMVLGAVVSIMMAGALLAGAAAAVRYSLDQLAPIVGGRP